MEATFFFTPNALHHRHPQDELRVSSLVPEIEAPASAPTPLAPAGASCFGPQLAATGSTGVTSSNRSHLRDVK